MFCSPVSVSASPALTARSTSLVAPCCVRTSTRLAACEKVTRAERSSDEGPSILCVIFGLGGSDSVVTTVQGARGYIPAAVLVNGLLFRSFSVTPL